MNITFKPIGKREREWLVAQEVRNLPPADAHRYGYTRGSCVTINGTVVLAFGIGGHVIYQDGSEAIADLVRAHKRVGDALANLTYDDLERIKSKGKTRYTVADFLHDSSVADTDDRSGS